MDFGFIWYDVDSIYNRELAEFVTGRAEFIDFDVQISTKSVYNFILFHYH